MKKLLVTLGVIGLALAGCSDIEAGKVTGKHTDSARTYCAEYKKHRCVRWETDDKDYILELRDGKKTGEVDVDEDTYHRVQVGQQYP